MNIEELKEIERRVVWKCFEKRIPELLQDVDDNVASDVTFSGGENEGNEIWMLEREDCSIVIESKADGILDMILTEPCHEIVSFNVIDKDNINDINENEVIDLISLFCKTFVSGNYHILLDHICGAEDWKIALKAYLAFEQANPDILSKITYI